MKPYYEHGGITIYHGDCREILPTLSRSALIVTDPPYGIRYVHGGGGGAISNNPRANFRRQREAITGDAEPFDASVLLTFEEVIAFGADHYAQQLPHGRWLVWDKTGGGKFSGLDSFSDVEMAWHSRNGASRIFHYLWKGVCQAGEKGQRRTHPSQKPIALMQWVIGQAKSVGVIVDPFAGSGTTLRAAKNLGRSAIGIEIEERYCEIAAKRLSQEVLDFGGAA